MPRRPKIKILPSRSSPGSLFYRTYEPKIKGMAYRGELYIFDKQLTEIPAKGKSRRVKIKRK